MAKTDPPIENTSFSHTYIHYFILPLPRKISQSLINETNQSKQWTLFVTFFVFPKCDDDHDHEEEEEEVDDDDDDDDDENAQYQTQNPKKRFVFVRSEF